RGGGGGRRGRLGRGGGRGGPRQPGADHDDVVLALVGRADEVHLGAMLLPLALDGTRRDVGVQLHGRYLTNPKSTASGNDTLPATTTVANTAANCCAMRS